MNQHQDKQQAQHHSRAIQQCLSWTMAASLTLALTGCGGNGDSSTASNSPAPQTTPMALDQIASATTIFDLETEHLPDEAAKQLALPLFHVAPITLNEPSDVNASDPNASARLMPQSTTVSNKLSRLSTRGLTPTLLNAANDSTDVGGLVRIQSAQSGDNRMSPMAAGSTTITYEPAQIRAAYGLAPLPTSFAGLSASQLAQFGAGQTVYIVNAHHNPNVAHELAIFNKKFGLPNCTIKSILPTATLPLPPTNPTGCELSVVYNTAEGNMTATAPSYESGWATEIALDVQWVHATAPLARIVLIEAPSASLNDLLGGIKLANKMGTGVVSMSFGAPEGSYTAAVDSVFSVKNMTYVAATGDSGAEVNWPAVSPKVIAVGGTTLSYDGSNSVSNSGSGKRSETAWSNAGGQVSAYTPTPTYQNNKVIGLSTPPVRRAVADVSHNADPASGQYVVTIAPNTSTQNWISAGGTSLAAPQWAGVLAITNANLALAQKPRLSGGHELLYGKLATAAGTYAANFADITTGSNGIPAKVGYDIPTGLGTPNVSTLVASITGAGLPASAPVVNAATITGMVGTPLSFTVSAFGDNPLIYTLGTAPSGMTLDRATGAIKWATPVAGSYKVSVTATDVQTKLMGQAVYTITINTPPPPAAPVVASATLNGKVGTALSFQVPTKSSNPLMYSLTGAPTGMVIGSTGLITWAKPVAGNYAVTVNVTDTKTKLTGKGTYAVVIAAATPVVSGPTITAAAMNGEVGKALTGTITVTAPRDITSLSLQISGAPMGMRFSLSGLTLTAHWASPVAGSYNMTMVVIDSKNRRAEKVIPITVVAK